MHCTNNVHILAYPHWAPLSSLMFFSVTFTNGQLYLRFEYAILLHQPDIIEELVPILPQHNLVGISVTNTNLSSSDILFT